MKIAIEGSGSFGTFLRQELPNVGFEIDAYATSIILAVPFSAYEAVARARRVKTNPNEEVHFINVCSVQEPSTKTLQRFTNRITSIHPLFGARTPIEQRRSILTHCCADPLDESHPEIQFLDKFKDFSDIIEGMSPAKHDKIMAKTHVAAVLAARQAKPFIDAAADVPDEFIPNSFRLLREFVKTLDDMPVGTMESIMANPYL